jgi:hypothetical protein
MQKQQAYQGQKQQQFQHQQDLLAAPAPVPVAVPAPVPVFSLQFVLSLIQKRNTRDKFMILCTIGYSLSTERHSLRIGEMILNRDPPSARYLVRLSRGKRK